jgi:hypothetical protein
VVRLLVSVLALCVALTARAQAQVSQWYLSPYVGSIMPDKPWRGRGSTILYGLDLGANVSPAWSAEVDVNGASLSDRFDEAHTVLSGGALQVLRIFNRDQRFAPYLSIGAGVTHSAPPSEAGVESRTEFMVQPGVGAIVKVWESADAADSLALRPDIKARWTHGWAHAPGNPVDVLFALGLTFSFGTIH